uniref:Protein lingerer n=1 Tax=Syphacia muris TaxID=451379 RepID=A0A0N5AX74_9BILA
MGGKGEQGEPELRATQDQIRIARLTQDSTSLEDDRINMQKLIKKVVETTRCTVAQAEIALYDADNNVEVAVNAILEDTYTDDNVWKEQKSRRSKRQENEEKNEEYSSNQRNTRSYQNRGSNRRGRGSDRGRGGYRGAGRGGRGGYIGRGGHQVSSEKMNGDSRISNNVWDNTQLKTVAANKEWSNTAVQLMDDTPEDTDWESAGTLVFSRREEIPPPMVIPTSAPSSVTSLPTSTVSAPISFAAVAAAGTNRAKENANTISNSQAKVSSSTGTKPVTSETSTTQINAVNQASVDSYNPVYQKYLFYFELFNFNCSGDVVSTSGQLVNTSANSASEPDHQEEVRDTLQPTQQPTISSSGRNSTIRGNSSQPAASMASVSASGGSSKDWATKLKNDLGIGTKSRSKPSVPLSKTVATGKPAQALQPKATQSTDTRQSSYSVEFVSGEPNDSTALPEYQFGFHVDTNNDESTEETFAASKSRTKNGTTLIPADSTSSLLTNGGSNELSSTISAAQQQSKVSTSSNDVGITPASTVHSSTLQRQQATSGLSLADTSSMSYPSPESRTSVAKPPLSLHQQQQAQHPLYTTTQFSYGSYPYMGMYSPVAGVRQEEGPYAALVQYPFAGMGQIDMGSLSTMLPPIPPQQQPSQPPPPVQPSQHQQRPDQHGNYVDLKFEQQLSLLYLKAYANAAGVTISSATGGTGSGLLSNQQHQQRADTSVTSSTVAPPPGFSGPPSNIPAATFTLPQPNHISSLFQMPPTYHPQLNQLPFSFMLPSVTGNGQHKLGHQIFTQQAVDDSLSEQRISSQQQKVYGGGHQQMDKYVSAGGNKDRLGGGAQATPPPQMYQAQAPQGYLSQQVSHHSHNKKAYSASQHWGTS